MHKCVDIIIGMAAGSEGKGKLVSMIAGNYKALVRTGGPNAAHTVYYNGHKEAFHSIPCGSLHAPDALLVFGANAQIDIEYLQKEIKILEKYDRWLDKHSGQPRLVIDPHATVIDSVDKIAENGGRMPDCGELYHHPRDCAVHNAKLTNTDVIVGGPTRKATKEANTCVGCPALPEDSAWKRLGSTTHGAGMNYIRKMCRGTKMAVPAGTELDLVRQVYEEVRGVRIGEPDLGDVLNEVERRLKNGKWVESAKVQPVQLAKDNEFLKPFIGPTAAILNQFVDHNKPIMLEGTQGALLSLHHSYWPKATSRDTNAAVWLSEAGLSPLSVRHIYGVARTFPIRVAGDSGPLSGTEISWDEVTAHATDTHLVEWQRRLEELHSIYHDFQIEAPLDPEEESRVVQEMAVLKERIAAVPRIEEVTTATKRLRRVFTFGEDDFKKAVAINRPTHLMLTFTDYLHTSDADKNRWEDLSQKTRDWVTTLESKLGVFFDYLSTGPLPEHTVDRSIWARSPAA